jgi:hypothetical protein
MKMTFMVAILRWRLGLIARSADDPDCKLALSL